MVHLADSPALQVDAATVSAAADRSRRLSLPLAGDGAPVALLLGAGFAVRALSQLVPLEDVVLRQGLSAWAPLLYCIGFGYALLGFSLARPPVWLHLGAASLLTGALLGGLVGKTPMSLALFVAGAVLMMLALSRAAVRSESGFPRLALLVAAAGSGLFALHAIAFAPGGELLQARFLRLGATAAMALPLLAMLYRVHAIDGTTRPTRLARILSGIGMVAVPLALVLSAFLDARLKYALGPASDCFTVTLIIACVQFWRSGNHAALAGFGTVLASMLLGKLMGFYAFDGPLPAPAGLAGYGDAWRASLRHFHIDIMVLGYAFLIWPSLIRPRTIAVAFLALTMGLCAPAMGDWSRLAGVATVLWVIAFWRGRAVQ